jgi:hypothetical protein
MVDLFKVRGAGVLHHTSLHQPQDHSSNGGQGEVALRLSLKLENISTFLLDMTGGIRIPYVLPPKMKKGWLSQMQLGLGNVNPPGGTHGAPQAQNFDKRDSLRREKAYKREGSCAF